MVSGSVRWSPVKLNNPFQSVATALIAAALITLFRTSTVAQTALSPLLTRLETTDAAGVRIGWEAASGWGPFQIESRDTLGPATWSPLPGAEARTTRRFVVDTRPRSTGSRFYRVGPVPDPASRGELLSAKLVRRLTKFEIALFFQFAGVKLTADNDVNFYSVEYRTVGPLGEETTASGAIAVPATTALPLPLVSYQHGTEVQRTEVPSALNLEGFVAVAMAAGGYLSVAPDYLGLGTSAFPYHPYQHAKTEATATVDLLRAARKFASASNLPLSGKVFLFGYSQGGHATLAAHREIERWHRDEFNLVASAPGAGAYDMSGTMFQDTISTRTPPNPYYGAYVLASYQAVYRVADSFGSMLRAPFNTNLVVNLLDGKHTSDELNAVLPPVPADGFDPAFLAAIKANPDHPLRVALRDNDLLDWAPIAPVRLFHCDGDNDVLFQNSVVALARLKANGATDVELVNGGNFDHGGCATVALLGAKKWFDTLK